MHFRHGLEMTGCGGVKLCGHRVCGRALVLNHTVCAHLRQSVCPAQPLHIPGNANINFFFPP